MKEILLARSGAFWLAARKFLYFAGACVLATILAGVGVSDAFEGDYSPAIGAVTLATSLRLCWYLFLFLLPWEAYKAISAMAEYNKLLEEAERRAADATRRADSFAHGFKFVQPEPEAPEPKRAEFEISRGGDQKSKADRVDWRADWEDKKAREFELSPTVDRAPIGFPNHGLKARAKQGESYAQWCARLGFGG